MAMGARKAFSEITESERARWMKIPITGCDGMPKTGQAWVRNGDAGRDDFYSSEYGSGD